MDKELLEGIDDMFSTLGFSKIYLNNRTTYFKKENYIRLDYINGMESFVLEYADGIKDAQNNVFEDGDLYPKKLGNEVILSKIKSELIKNTIGDLKSETI